MKYISTTASPMTAIARYLKAMDENAVIVFIGPCIAKKQEIKEVKNTADYVITFEELESMFSALDIKLEKVDESEQDGSTYGKNFAKSGGVAASVKEAYNEQFGTADVTCRQCAGADECKKALMMLKVGKLPEDIIEGMICKMGCISGPAVIAPTDVALKHRNEIFKQTKQVRIDDNLEKHKFSGINMEVK